MIVGDIKLARINQAQIDKNKMSFLKCGNDNSKNTNKQTIKLILKIERLWGTFEE